MGLLEQETAASQGKAELGLSPRGCCNEKSSLRLWLTLPFIPTQMSNVKLSPQLGQSRADEAAAAGAVRSVGTAGIQHNCL